ncbi:MAG: hypothetical protein QXQ66_07630 [Candidatus Hadarchaeum sp.]|uniref:hypothetical protein n=1 Tax=Candidatus Hadarchaeum sp. TaxID=2883567 RepID=UPI00317242DB
MMNRPKERSWISALHDGHPCEVKLESPTKEGLISEAAAGTERLERIEPCWKRKTRHITKQCICSSIRNAPDPLTHEI